MTAYHFTCTDRFYEDLEILLRFVTTPYFTDENVAKEKGIIGQEIDMLEDTPGWSAYVGVLQALYAVHPVRISVAGSKQSIAPIDPDVLRLCHRGFYSPKNLVLVVCGQYAFDGVVELAQRIMELRQCGVTEFQVACDPGVGLYAAEIINTLRVNDLALRLICALPHEGQATKWTPQLRDRYFNMLASCTDIICIALHEQPDAQFSAYQQIIKQSEVLMTVYDPDLSYFSAEDKAVAYALTLGKPTLVIHPQTRKARWVNMPDNATE